MQELIKIKENSFCVIRALSGKSTYIRLYFHFLNAEVITCSATLNIFSSCLLNCIASAWSQLILPGRQPGGEAHLHPQRYWRHLWQQQGHRMFTLVHILKTKSGFGVITNNCSFVDMLCNFKITQHIFHPAFPQTLQLGYCRTQRRAYEDVQFFSPAPVGPLCKNWPWAHVSAQYPQTASNRAKLILILI